MGNSSDNTTIQRAKKIAAGKVRVKAETRDDGVLEEQTYEFPLDAHLPDITELGAHVASVGCSTSVGMSTQYAREKMEVVCWVTLPCQVDDKSIRQTFELCQLIAQTEADRFLDSTQAKFFAHLTDDQD